MAHPLFDYSQLSPEERLQLAEDLWDSLIREHPAAIPVPASHTAEVARRLARFRADGNRGRPWRDVLDRIDATLTTGVRPSLDRDPAEEPERGG